VLRSGMFLEIYVPPIWRHIDPHTITWEEVTKCEISGHFPIVRRLVAASYFIPAEIELCVHDASHDEISGATSSLAQWLCYRGLPSDLVGLIGHYTAAVWCHRLLFFCDKLKAAAHKPNGVPFTSHLYERQDISPSKKEDRGNMDGFVLCRCNFWPMCGCVGHLYCFVDQGG
jgi:hypothetical protein